MSTPTNFELTPHSAQVGLQQLLAGLDSAQLVAALSQALSLNSANAIPDLGTGSVPQAAVAGAVGTITESASVKMTVNKNGKKKPSKNRAKQAPKSNRAAPSTGQELVGPVRSGRPLNSFLAYRSMYNRSPVPGIG